METYWFKRPSELFRSSIAPSTTMTNPQRLNALTRLIIVITIILLIVWPYDGHWWRFLICGLIIVFILYLSLRTAHNDFIAYLPCEKVFPDKEIFETSFWVPSREEVPLTSQPKN